MDTETTGHVHQIWVSLVDHIPTIGLLLGGMIGSIIWAAKRTFATREYIREMDMRNEKKHEDIERQVQVVSDDVSWIKGYLEKK